MPALISCWNLVDLCLTIQNNVYLTDEETSQFWNRIRLIFRSELPKTPPEINMSSSLTIPLVNLLKQAIINNKSIQVPLTTQLLYRIIY